MFKIRKVSLLSIIIILFFSSLNVKASMANVYDTTKPVLHKIEFSNYVVKAGESVKVVVDATDEGSGVKEIGWFTMRNPSGNSGTSTSTFFLNVDGKWEGTLSIPENAESGEWYIESLGISDNTGNYLQLDQTSLQSYPFSKGFTVEGVNSIDTTKPVLHNIEFSNYVVKAGESVKVFVDVTDEGSGVKEIGWFTMRNPSGNSGTSTSTFFLNVDGKWEGTLSIPENAESGEWHIESLGISDNTGNYLQLDQTSLQSYPFSKGFTVEGVNNIDTTKPVLHNIEFSNYVMKAGESVKVFVDVTDEGSGVKGIGWFTMRNPSRNSGTSTSTFFLNTDGKWEGTLVIPENAESGEWYIESLGISDNTGNYLQLDQVGLTSYSFPKGFTVTTEATSKIDTVTVQIDKTGPQKVGTPITITATSTGSGSPLYKFWAREKNGIWRVLQDYSSASNYTWVPDMNGEYQFSVHVKDQHSKLNYEKYESFYYTIKDFVENVAVQIDKTGPQKVGTPITITATSTGSRSPLYKFWVREGNGTWKILQDYSSASSYTWVPDMNGQYQFSVHVKDQHSKLNYEKYESFYYTIKDFVENVTVQTDKTGPQKVGTPITITATSTGSRSPLYKFWVREGNGTWKVLQDYSSESSYTWVPDMNGEYQFSIHVKDQYSKLKYEKYESINYSIRDFVENVGVQTDKTSPLKVGTPITITATSTGSVSPLYKYWYREKGGEWKVLKEYGPENIYSWIPTMVGEYQFSIHAKDSNSNLSYDKYYSFYIQVTPDEFFEVRGNRIGNSLINQTDDWVYYSNLLDYGRLYKMKNDGSQKTLLSDGKYVSDINVIDQWIYFRQENFLYRMRIDSSELVLIDSGTNLLSANGNFLYYFKNGRYLMKSSLDGTVKEKIADILIPHNMVVKGDWIYYSSDYSLMKLKTDGSNLTRVINDRVVSFDIVEDWIYYNTHNSIPSISKIKTDGSEYTLIKYAFADSIYKVDDSIYFKSHNFDTGTDYLSQLDLNTLVINNLIENLDKFNVTSDAIYYNEKNLGEWKRYELGF